MLSAVWSPGDGISCIYTLIAYKIHVRRLNCRIYSANFQKNLAVSTIAPMELSLRQLMRVMCSAYGEPAFSDNAFQCRGDFNSANDEALLHSKR